MNRKLIYSHIGYKAEVNKYVCVYISSIKKSMTKLKLLRIKKKFVIKMNLSINSRGTDFGLFWTQGNMTAPRTLTSLWNQKEILSEIRSRSHSAGPEWKPKSVSTVVHTRKRIPVSCLDLNRIRPQQKY